MKPSSALLSVLILASGVAMAQSASGTAVVAAASATTPAQQAMVRAQAAVVANPKSAEELARLALAQLRRARETGDDAFVVRADETVKQARTLSPNDFGAQKAGVAVSLTRHQYEDALTLAKVLNRHAPDDISVYGYLVQAESALGNYDEAEKAANWMFRLRPGNTQAMICGAELRETFGLLSGATDLFTTALQATPLAETEERAWLLTQLARLDRLQGKLPEASQLAEAGLRSFPDYHLALAELAQVRMQQGNAEAAVMLLRQLNRQAPNAGNLYSLATMLAAAGQKVESQKLFAEFEQEAVSVAHEPLNYNCQLALYYADVAGRPVDALAVAEREVAARRDVVTLDAYAWVLFRNGRTEEARKFADLAQKIGSKDVALLQHAEKIGQPPMGAASRLTTRTPGN